MSWLWKYLSSLPKFFEVKKQKQKKKKKKRKEKKRKKATKATLNDELDINKSPIDFRNYMAFTASMRSGRESNVDNTFDHGESPQDDLDVSADLQTTYNRLFKVKQTFPVHRFERKDEKKKKKKG
jgi:hypothetical protein